MHAGWLQFGRRGAGHTTASPDSSVTGARVWLLRAAIVASTAALLGTSPEPTFSTTYTFERRDIDGGFVELTRDRPTATFFVTIHADDLGPDGVITTGDARSTVRGTLTTSDVTEGKAAPFVSVKLSSPERPAADEKLVIDDYTQGQVLVFGGDCKTPKSGKACATHFMLELSRQDNGDSGGSVRFDWSFDVSSKGTVHAKEDTTVGPLDPPWTVDVSEP